MWQYFFSKKKLGPVFHEPWNFEPWNFKPSRRIFPFSRNSAEVEKWLAITTIFDLMTQVYHRKNQTELPKIVGPTNSYLWLDRLHFWKEKEIDNFLCILLHNSAQCHYASHRPFKNKNLCSAYSQMEGHGEPRNLYNFAAVGRGILQTGLQNLTKFCAENCGPW